MHNQDLTGILAFLRHAENLKNTYRLSYTSQGRVESTAEHTWHLCLMALCFEKEIPDIDFRKLLKMLILHDLGETISGDIPAIHQSPNTAGDKTAQEQQDMKTLTTPLPAVLRDEFMSLWEEYETMSSAEAVVAKGLDKLTTILQHNIGRNPDDFDYAFNIDYGRKYTDMTPLLARMRQLLDDETKTHARNRQQIA